MEFNDSYASKNRTKMHFIHSQPHEITHNGLNFGWTPTNTSADQEVPNLTFHTGLLIAVGE